jgi:hypothetical protein
MCNDYGNHVPYSAYIEAFSELRIPVRFPQAAPNLEPRSDNLALGNGSRYPPRR